jgi:hypothetical protein
MLLEPPTDTVPRYRGSFANRAWRPPSPDVFSARSHLRWWRDSERMRSLTGGVCIKLLTMLRHNPKARCRASVSRLKGPSRSKACSFSLYSQAQKTCDDYYHDHHTDDVKDVHCVLLRVRDANPLEGWQICDWVHAGSSCHGCQSAVGGTHALIDQRKSVQNCSHCRIKSAAIWRLSDQAGRNAASSAAFM